MRRWKMTRQEFRLLTAADAGILGSFLAFRYGSAIAGVLLSILAALCVIYAALLRADRSNKP